MRSREWCESECAGTRLHGLHLDSKQLHMHMGNTLEYGYANGGFKVSSSIAHPALVFVVRPLFQNRKEKNMHVFRNKSMGSKTKRGNTHVFSTYTRAFDKSIDNDFISTFYFFRLHTSITA